MSYPGGPPQGYGGYWNGHDPPNLPPYSMQQMHRQPVQNGAGLPYQEHSPSQIGSYRNPLLHYAQGQDNMSMAHSVNSFDASAPSQPPFEQSAFINPAQLFSRPPAHPAELYRPALQASHSHPTASTVPTTAYQAQPMQTSKPPVDRPLLLMSLAEEFFDAAHNLAPSVSVSRTTENVEAYDKLISTGLACLDTALRHVRLSPRVEANIRLRYAGVLYEETDNFMEAETALSKGIALCDRVCFHLPRIIIF